jgi:hypothetical protein
LQVLQLAPQVAPEQGPIALQFGPPYSSLRPEQNPPATCLVAVSLNTRMVSRLRLIFRLLCMSILSREHIARSAESERCTPDCQSTLSIEIMFMNMLAMMSRS